MAQIHTIDGVTIYVSQAHWDSQPVDTSLNLIAIHPARRRLSWLVDAQTMTEWHLLQTARGSIVRIVTPPAGDLNGDYVTYYDAIVESVTEPQHEARNMRRARIDFLVRV